ncbi:hypothetical protein HCA33_03970 [Listeria seeligeri]|uniref:hypothetical protein n=1 Tax=Listeria seeligeri TaxID=1640 RepID=UPI0016263F06|nr:hypothetical protein [Listeria seeligeri]MBC1541934.1 hypothetical protein [Listeria seeligeri]MBC1583029.1 hypothetical protein [Listeria seeligeri]MBC1774336.1 hypothetical protein [Listeria seeligeri]MBC1879169.1 hypothetical protein [Listeria seeligeri]MBC2210241.1 hypothetical protein [Listeria seeligeri]
MPKKGRFVIWGNKEYKIVNENTNNILIMTSDADAINSGFIDKYGSGVYTKWIEKEEISDIYPLALYKGNKFDVQENEKDGKFNLGTGHEEIAQELGFKAVDKYYFIKWVPKNEVEIIEERKVLSLD